MEIDAFISAVFNNDVLWNKKNPCYKNKEMRIQLWEGIGREFHMKGKDAEATFAKLRAKYGRVKREMSEAVKSGAGAACVKPWEYMEQLKFLDDVVVPRKTNTLMPLTWKPSMSVDNNNADTSMSAENNVEVLLYDIENTVQDDIKVDRLSSEEEYQEEESRLFSPSGSTTSSGIIRDPVPTHIPKRRRKQSRTSLGQQLSSLTDALSLPLVTKEATSEIDLFSALIGKKLQKIPQEKLFDVQLKLLNVLNEEMTNL